MYAPAQLFKAGKRLAAKLLGNKLGLGGIGIYHGIQFDPVSLLLKLVVHARVVLAERADTNDCYAN
jgi:hypothetical protein